MEPPGSPRFPRGGVCSYSYWLGLASPERESKILKHLRSRNPLTPESPPVDLARGVPWGDP